MTFDAARAELAALEVNPLWGHEKQTVEVRKAALAILDKLEAALAGQPQPSNCPDCGTPITCCEQEKRGDE